MAGSRGGGNEEGDRFDQVTERDFDRTLPIVTTPQSASELEERGFSSCIPLDVWESLNVDLRKEALRGCGPPPPPRGTVRRWSISSFPT